MKKVTLKEAFAQENLDPNTIEIKGVPERHIEALKAVAQLFVMHDAVNPDFQPDYTNRKQSKHENWFKVGSPSGVGFSFDGCDGWHSNSVVGARLVSEFPKASEYIAEECKEQYKKLMVYERPTAKK
ncbi:hypothetical protein CJ739_101 [Mariniflexile rhizosphaerae]|uniref:hypothetical protein n=1 Tax=unclassified Mariniflexile TaxID=2643887 RepID=UPI000E331193|nr:hypothetical protein [Mariniflexile sp. TRM1-10]AXP79201.1 hypothetical protein CJ739_101 [Mariniflexile sp. TRM1-10]